MSNLKKSIKEQNSDKLKELKEVSRNTKREKTKNFVGCALNKVASLFVGKARVEYQSFLNLHDENKIGTVEKGFTKNGAKAYVVYTEQGPLVQTASADLYNNRPSKSQPADISKIEAGLNINATYEGYIQSYEGVWIYAKVSKAGVWKEDETGISEDSNYSIIMSDASGKFVTIKNTSSNDHILIRGKKYPCAQKVYFDLSKRFVEELQKVKK